jgi:hypothetical protein
MVSRVEREAVLSDDGRYRYVLGRRWATGATALWIMLNPSIADAVVDDPTVKRVVRFSQREGFGAARIANLFAYRTPYPTDLLTVEDPVGGDNDERLQEEIAATHLIVAAWGDSPVLRRPLGRLRLDQVRQLSADRKVRCLGLTQGGHPRHPGRLASATELRTFSWPQPQLLGSRQEDQVHQHFEIWLREGGWTLRRDQGHADVIATRDGVQLIAEVKGITQSAGLDIDTAYGQVLRRMSSDASSVYGIVLPSELEPFALRVSDRVRQSLRITIYLVDANGDVHLA